MLISLVQPTNFHINPSKTIFFVPLLSIFKNYFTFVSKGDGLWFLHSLGQEDI